MSEQKTHAEIIAEMRFHGQQNIDAEKDKPEYGILTMEGRITQNYADRLDAAHKREVDALKQRCAKLNAEVAAKDEVIKRLNDAIAEEQRRKMATTEKSSVVGDAAKLPKTVDLRFDICQNIELVLKIGRDYQNKDGYRGAHYDTVKLLCDAIEYQQEQLKTKTKVGDCAKLREAVKHIKDRLPHMLQYMRVHWEDASAGGYFDELMLVIDATLAAPARNCDVGTAKEQGERFDTYCFNRRTRERCCEDCPIKDAPCCELAWAQLPYESEATDGE